MKRRVALQWGYNGKNYSGLQYNYNVKTLEGDLINILLKIKLISEQNTIPTKIGMKTASRTDKMVSALFNVTCFKINQELTDEVKEKLNDELKANNFIMYKITKVSKIFVPHKMARSREYKYFIPVGLTNITDLNINEEILNNLIYSKPNHSVETLNEILNNYKGINDYVNFTATNQENTKRNIRRVEIKKIVTFDKIEWYEIFLHGDSFVIHQIRKMVMFFIITLSKINNENVKDKEIVTKWFKNAFNPDIKSIIPKAPGNFLYLTNIYFPDHNEKTAYDRIEVAFDDKKEFECQIQKDILTSDNSKRWLDTLQKASKYKKEYSEIFDKDN